MSRNTIGQKMVRGYMSKKISRANSGNGLWLVELIAMLILIIALICGGSTYLGFKDNEFLFTPISGYPPHDYYFCFPEGTLSVLIVPEFPLIGTLAPIIILAVALFVYKFRGKPLILKR